MADPVGLRVCHLVHSLALGGLETQLRRLIRAMDVTSLVGYVGRDESLRDGFEADGTRVVRLGRGDGRPARQFDPRAVRRVARFLDREAIDVLHCHTSLYLHVVGRLCGRAAGVPVVGTYHNTSDTFHPATRLAERLTRRASRTNLAVSCGVERSFGGDGRRYEPGEPVDRSIYTVYNGIDVAAFRNRVADSDPTQVFDEWGIDPETTLALCVGRYAPEKDQRTLIEGYAAADCDAHLLLVGWGAMESDLRARADRLGVADGVTVTGRVPDVAPYYAAADLFALPSLTEGLPVTLLESMAAGLPVVATDVPGTREAVVDGETGILVPPGSPSAIADALAELDPPTRERLGAAGLARARSTFDIERTAAAYRSVYDHVTD